MTGQVVIGIEIQVDDHHPLSLCGDASLDHGFDLEGAITISPQHDDGGVVGISVDVDGNIQLAVTVEIGHRGVFRLFADILDPHDWKLPVPDPSQTVMLLRDRGTAGDPDGHPG